MTCFKMSHIRSLNAVTLFRIAFGIVWLIDGVMKFVWLQPSDVIKLVHELARINLHGSTLGSISVYLL